MIYSERILDAFRLTHDLHGNQRRKCSGVPYITHLMAVAALVGEYGGDEDQFVAALLHDAVEDQGGKPVLERIRTQFGNPVADLVWACSDAWKEPKPRWEDRKAAHIARIPNSPKAARLILAADKLHNLRSMLRTYTPDEDQAFWQQFRGRRDGTLWYYHAMGEALRDGWEHPILKEVEDALQLFKERLA